jgi:hypothetical protein
MCLRPAWAKVMVTSCLKTKQNKNKRAWGIAQVVELLSCMCKAQGSIPSTGAMDKCFDRKSNSTIRFLFSSRFCALLLALPGLGWRPSDFWEHLNMMVWKFTSVVWMWF